MTQIVSNPPLAKTARGDAHFFGFFGEKQSQTVRDESWDARLSLYIHVASREPFLFEHYTHGNRNLS